MKARLRKGQAPIAAQVFLLLVVTVLLSQAMMLVGVLIAPPLPPPTYSITEVAAAMKNGVRKINERRPLQRRHVATMPTDLSAIVRGGRSFQAIELAEALGAPPEAIVFVQRRASQFILPSPSGPGFRRLTFALHRHLGLAIPGGARWEISRLLGGNRTALG